MATVKGLDRPQATGSRIPAFNSIEEAAEFWDTHDSAEFEDEFEEVDDVRFIGLKGDGAMILWFRPETIALLTERAKEHGTTPTLLARRWVLEQLGLPGDQDLGQD